MANTWHTYAGSVAYALNKSMGDTFNATGSARIIRVFRAWHMNNSLTAVVGVILSMEVRLSTAATGGTAITPIAHDTNNSALAAETTAGTGRTVTDGGQLRRYTFANEEPIVTGAAFANWLTLIPFTEIWNSGYGDTTVQAVTLRAIQGFHLKNITSTVVGAADIEMEFTDAAS